MSTEKKRSANFSEQECVLLMDLLGELSDFNQNLTRFQFLKHKFTNGITSKTKKEQWMLIHEKFVASSGTNRSADELEKKTNNLIQKHRNIYSDYIRSVNQTGGGPRTPTLSFLTEAVMAVIGKDSVNVAGVCLPIQTDSTMMAMASIRNDYHSENGEQEDIHEKETRIDVPIDANTVCTPTTSERVTLKRSSQNAGCHHCAICCKSTQEIHQLKKKKLQLEIELLQKKLKEE